MLGRLSDQSIQVMKPSYLKRNQLIHYLFAIIAFCVTFYFTFFRGIEMLHAVEYPTSPKESKYNSAVAYHSWLLVLHVALLHHHSLSVDEVAFHRLGRSSVH